LLPADNAAQTNDRRGGFMTPSRAYMLSAQVTLLDLEPENGARTATQKKADSFGVPKTNLPCSWR
jgi:hypothetical protein